MSEQTQQPQPENMPVFSIEKIYTKDISLEVPGAPSVFLKQEQPTVDMQVTTEGKPVEAGFFDCTIGVTITAKLPEDKIMFICEIKQAAVFRIQNVPEEELEAILAIACPNILFPYAREVVSDITTRAGFPPVILAPINFEAMYMQQLEAKKQSAEQVAGSETVQ